MAAMHELSFPPGGRWGADALSLQLGLPGAFGWIAGVSGFVLARVAADEAEILTLAVVPQRRRCGVGWALLDAACVEAVGCGAVAMLLEVAAGNVAAQALYAGFGFVEVGVRRGYYGLGADALIFRCELTPGVSRAR